jgi:endogenous inhibitor of DNA gyrase (YacG/DUF329 family)
MRRKCPTCGRLLDAETAAAGLYRPFCSERCRTADLGSWLDGAYRISRPLDEEELDQGLAARDAEHPGDHEAHPDAQPYNRPNDRRRPQ